MMPVTAAQLEKLFSHTLRVELISGKVLFYKLDSENREWLINKLARNSEGFEENINMDFVWFETFRDRMMVINNKEILRLTFLVDILPGSEDNNGYFDNFGMVEKDTTLVNKKTVEGQSTMYVLDEEFLPQAMIFHKGKPSDDKYYSNPMQYNSLVEGCLQLFHSELDGLIPLRQFINFTDDDGEESFIPLQQIIVFEFDANLLYDADREQAFQEEMELEEDWDDLLETPPAPVHEPINEADFNKIVDEHLRSILDINFLLDEESEKENEDDAIVE